MKRAKAAMVGVAAVFAGGAWAGKVNMPKSGNFEFHFCMVGEGESMTGGDKVSVSHDTNVANLRTEPGGRPFDRVSSQCYGTWV